MSDTEAWIVWSNGKPISVFETLNEARYAGVLVAHAHAGAKISISGPHMHFDHNPVRWATDLFRPLGTGH